MGGGEHNGVGWSVTGGVKATCRARKGEGRGGYLTCARDRAAASLAANFSPADPSPAATCVPDNVQEQRGCGVANKTRGTQSGLGREDTTGREAYELSAMGSWQRCYMYLALCVPVGEAV
jgi:hypothetical protein